MSDSTTSDEDVKDEEGVDESTVSPDGDEGDLDSKIAKLEEKYENMLKAVQAERNEKKAFRAEAQSLRRELEDLKTKKEESDAFEGLEDEDAIPVATVKKLFEKERVRSVKESFIRDVRLGELSARMKHSDFDEVVTPDLIAELEVKVRTDPDSLKAMLGGDSDPVNLAEHIYQTVKSARPQEPEEQEEPEPQKKGPRTMGTTGKGAPVSELEKKAGMSLDEKRKAMRKGKSFISFEDLM